MAIRSLAGVAKVRSRDRKAKVRQPQMPFYEVVDMEIEFCVHKMLNLFLYIKKRKIEKRYGKISEAEFRAIAGKLEIIDLLSQYISPGFWGYLEEVFGRSDNLTQLADSLDCALLNLKTEIMEIFEEFEPEYEKQWITDKKELIEYKMKLESLWDEFGKGILQEAERALGAGWGVTKVNVYLVSQNLRASAKSSPLIFPLRNETDAGLMEILTHELLHVHSQIHSRNPAKESLWSNLALEFRIKRVHQEQKVRITHAIIYSLSSHIVKLVLLDKDFVHFHIRSYSEIDKETGMYANLVDENVRDYLEGRITRYEFCQEIVEKILNSQWAETIYSPDNF